MRRNNSQASGTGPPKEIEVTMQTRVQSLLLVVALLFAAVLSTSCGASVQIPSKPMPSGATFTGLWYSNYGDMKLVQKDDSVTGTFDYKTGGRIAGTVTGGVLRFDWVQDGDLSVGRREITGKGYFVISDDGLKFEGQWGYGDNLTDGGTWTAEKAVENYDK